MSTGGLLIAGMSFLAVVGFYVFARLAPVWHTRHQGCDAYYFILCAEAFHGKREIPIRLPPLYLLEPEEQWYPPGFPVAIGLLPPRWLKRNFWLVSHILDAGVLVGIFWIVTQWLGLGWGIIAALVYASEPNLVSEYRSLTSRPLGVLLFYLFFGTAAAGVLSHPGWLIVAAVAGVATFYTHKLTTQLLMALTVWLTALRQEPAWVYVLAGALLMAFVANRELFVKVLRAHWDIVSFWYRNWRWLGAHQVRQSPIYGDGNAEDWRFHRGDGIRGWAFQIKRVVIANPWVLLPLVAVIERTPLTGLELLLMQTIAGIYIWALGTLLVPWLRCLGEGTKYVKLAEPLTLIMGVLVLARTDSSWVWALGGCCLAFHAYHYRRVWLRQRRWQSDAGVVNPDLQRILDRLARDERSRIVCLPTHLADLVAHEARRPVLWGTHGYGFREVEPFFPVIRRRLSEFVRQYRLTHLLLDKRFAKPDELGMDLSSGALESGQYVLIPLDAGAALE